MPTSKPRLFRAAYGGGPKGGRWSETAKLETLRRLLRMVVRVVLGPQKVSEYDALWTRLNAMTPEQMDAEVRRAKAELRASLDRDSQTEVK